MEHLWREILLSNVGSRLPVASIRLSMSDLVATSDLCTGSEVGSESASKDEDDSACLHGNM